jgi:hypothetical protein
METNVGRCVGEERNRGMIWRGGMENVGPMAWRRGERRINRVSEDERP